MLKIFYINNRSKTEQIIAEILKKYFDFTFDYKNYKKNEFGKPYIENSPYFFNVSHTDNMTIIAVSDSQVGIDVENSKRNVPKVIKDKFFPECETNFEAIKLWTIKEAAIKYFGESIFYNRFTIEKDELNYLGQPFFIKPVTIELNELIISFINISKSYEFIEII